MEEEEQFTHLLQVEDAVNGEEILSKAAAKRFCCCLLWNTLFRTMGRRFSVRLRQRDFVVHSGIHFFEFINFGDWAREGFI